MSCDVHVTRTSLRSRTPDGVDGTWDDPLEALRWMSDDLTSTRRRQLRWVGYIGYDFGRMFEALP